MKVTYETKAWASDYNRATLEQLATPEVADSLMYGNADFSTHNYSLVGKATITVEFVSKEELVGNKIATLKEMISTTRAEAAAKVTLLEGEIQKLLSIENNPTEVTDDDGIPF